MTSKFFDEVVELSRSKPSHEDYLRKDIYKAASIYNRSMNTEWIYYEDEAERIKKIFEEEGFDVSVIVSGNLTRWACYLRISW